MGRIVKVTLDELPLLTEAQKQRLNALAQRPDSEIDFSDIPETADKFWKHARPLQEIFEERRLARERRVVLELDPNVLEWLRGADEKVNPARVNEVLREAMEKDLLKRSA